MSRDDFRQRRTEAYEKVQNMSNEDYKISHRMSSTPLKHNSGNRSFDTSKKQQICSYEKDYALTDQDLDRKSHHFYGRQEKKYHNSIDSIHNEMQYSNDPQGYNKNRYISCENIRKNQRFEPGKVPQESGHCFSCGGEGHWRATCTVVNYDTMQANKTIPTNKIPVPPPPPPNINGIRTRNTPEALYNSGTNVRTTHRTHDISVGQTGQRNKERARTPEHSEFEARRRSKDEVDTHISRMTNRNESTYNLKPEERDYLRRHQDTSGKFNIPPHSNLPGRDLHQTKSERQNFAAEHRYSPERSGYSKNQESPMPSTSYATKHSNHHSERNRTHHSPLSNSVKKSSTATPYQKIGANQPREHQRKTYASNLDSKINGQERSPRRDSNIDIYRYNHERYKSNKGIDKQGYKDTELKGDERRNNSPRHKENWDCKNPRRQNEISQELNVTKNQKSREMLSSSTVMLNRRGSGSVERRHLDVPSKSDEYKNCNSDRMDPKNVTVDCFLKQEPVSNDQRHPLISQQEAFKRQQEQHNYNEKAQRKERRECDNENHAGARKQTEKYQDFNKEINFKTSDKQTQDNSHKNRNSSSSKVHLDSRHKMYVGDPSPTRRNQSRDNDSSISLTDESRKDSTPQDRNYNRSAYCEEEKYDQYKILSNRKTHSENTTHDKQCKEENSDKSGSRFHSSKTDNAKRRRGTEINKSEKDKSEHSEKTKRRKLSDKSRSETSSRKKGKNVPGISSKGKRSASGNENKKSVHMLDTKENKGSRESDIDSVSSETKRVSALARLGPKVTLRQRLSKLPDENDASSEFMKNDVDLIKNEVCLQSAEAKIVHSQESSSRQISTEHGNACSGIQITISNGPDDHSQRIVSSENNILQETILMYGDGEKGNCDQQQNEKKSKAGEFNAEPAHSDTKLEDCRNCETDIDSTTVFGEFDPDAFEVLDEVGGDDDPLPISNLADEADLQVDPSRIHENQTDSHMMSQQPKNDANSIKEADAYTLAEQTHKYTNTALSSANENLRQEFYVKTEDATTSQKNLENDLSSGPKRHLIEDLALDHVVGEEYIRKVEVMYCDLCHKYLDPRIESENDFKILKQKHCLKKEHKNAYSKLVGENEAPKEVSLNTTGRVTCSVQPMKPAGYSSDEDQLDFEAEEPLVS